MVDLLVRDCTIINGDVPPVRGSVAIAGEKIAAILPPDTDSPAAMVIEGQGKVLFPGVIDPHVHYRYDRGYDNGTRDYITETWSALLGGVTTAIRMYRELGAYADHVPSELALLNA